MRAGQTDVSRCKRRVSLDRLLEITNTTLLDACFAVAFVEGEPAFKIALVDFRRDGTYCGKPLVFLPGHRNFDLSGDRLRHLALQSKHVPQLAIIGFRPEVLVGRTANQLSADTNPTAL